MARDTRAAFLRALAPQLSAIERAYLQAVMDQRSAALQTSVEAMTRRLMETGNLEQAMLDARAILLFYERGFYADLDRKIQETFYSGGAYQLSLLPKRSSNTAPRMVARFDPGNPRAERWMSTRSARLISEISEDTEVLVRETLAEAVQENRPYRRTARDLTGTTQGNELRGGLIGLHSSEARAVRNARRDLEGLDTRYFSREARDKRFDPTIRKAMDEGKPLSTDLIARATGRYSDILLKKRGERIARTEGNKAANAGRREAIQQLIDSGKIRADLVTKVWRATIGKHTRESHLALNGQEVPFDGKFISPVTGAALDHPHDENAPAAEVLNCRCNAAYRIRWSEIAR